MKPYIVTYSVGRAGPDVYAKIVRAQNPQAVLTYLKDSFSSPGLNWARVYELVDTRPTAAASEDLNFPPAAMS